MIGKLKKMRDTVTGWRLIMSTWNLPLSSWINNFRCSQFWIVYTVVFPWRKHMVATAKYKLGQNSIVLDGDSSTVFCRNKKKAFFALGGCLFKVDAWPGALAWVLLSAFHHSSVEFLPFFLPFAVHFPSALANSSPATNPAQERQNVNRGDWGSVLVCLKPKSVVAESEKSVEVKNLFVCVKQTQNHKRR